jgi:hypothetical protein
MGSLFSMRTKLSNWHGNAGGNNGEAGKNALEIKSVTHTAE